MFLQFLTNIQNDGLKKWNFKVKNSSQDLIQKLNAAFESASGFAFNLKEDKSDSVVFKLRKRIQYSDQILHRNRITVNGKLFKTDSDNETNVEVSFTQQYVMVMTVLSIAIFGLILLAFISKMSSGGPMFALGVMLIGVGVVMWLALKKKLENDILKYKKLISDILES